MDVKATRGGDVNPAARKKLSHLRQLVKVLINRFRPVGETQDNSSFGVAAFPIPCQGVSARDPRLPTDGETVRAGQRTFGDPSETGSVDEYLEDTDQSSLAQAAGTSAKRRTRAQPSPHRSAPRA